MPCVGCAARRAAAKRLAQKAAHALAKWKKTGGNPAPRLAAGSGNDKLGRNPAAKPTKEI